MHVSRRWIRSGGNRERVRLVGDARDLDGDFVRSETDLISLIVGIGTGIEHALNVVRIAASSPAR